MGKFQNVTLFGVGAKSTDSIVTCNKVEAMSRPTP